MSDTIQTIVACDGNARAHIINKAPVEEADISDTIIAARVFEKFVKHNVLSTPAIAQDARPNTTCAKCEARTIL